jgi:hypothetical protein
MALRVQTQISGDVFIRRCDGRIVFGDEGGILRERVGNMLMGTPRTHSRTASFRGRSSHTRCFLLGRLSLNIDPSLEVRAFINGDALGCDVARDNGRLL